MNKDDRSSPVTPTQAAKRKVRVPRGGAPVIKNGPAPVNQGYPQTQGYVPGVPMEQALNQPNPRQSRSQAEIAADMQRLAEAIEAHSEQNPITEENSAVEQNQNTNKPPAPNVEEEGGGVDVEDLSDEWLLSDEPGDILNNTRVRKKIEKGLTSLSVEDLIMHGEVQQDVILIRNKQKPSRPRLWVTFRSISGQEDLEIKKRFYEEEGPDRFVLDRYSLMNLCSGILSVNGVPLPNHLDSKGDFDEDSFQIKYRKVSRMAQQLLSFLVVNYIWFDERVRKTLVTEELGNG
jgi:hypothetical protein